LLLAEKTCSSLVGSFGQGGEHEFDL